jgi:hypothetical protein
MQTDSLLRTIVVASAIVGNLAALAQTPTSQTTAIAATSGLRPNLKDNIGRPLRYRPEGGDFVIEDGVEFFNRSLYGGNTAFRVDGGDKPEFTLYLPGRGGNLRLGVGIGGKTLWLKDARHIVTRYRPGELLYTITDPILGPDGSIALEVLAYAATEGLIVRAQARHIGDGAELLWAYGGVNGQRGSRDGDIGTERVPISQYFQLQPAFAEGNTFTLSDEGFTLHSQHATIAGITPAGTRQHVADADAWDDLPALLGATASTSSRPVVVGRAPFAPDKPLLLSLQRLPDGSAQSGDLGLYREVTAPPVGGAAAVAPKPPPAPLPPAYDRTRLPELFAMTDRHFADLREKVRIETPDPYLDAAMAALNVVADALWDDDARAIMHGAIAWRTKLLGWRGPYTLDDLGWHDRARENFETWLPNQNRNPIPAVIPGPDPAANMARNEPGLHSNGDLSNSHYDMNMVFIDALFRHLLWTGDRDYARQVWPVIERHLAWERRLFRREYGDDKLPLYEAYASIWASDDLYYNGGGTAYGSAYNVYANRMAARVAVLAGVDPTPYSEEADRILKAMHSLLWLPEARTFAEFKDLTDNQLVHPDYGLWNFYHTVDEEAVTPREAWSMGSALLRDAKPIPVQGSGVPDDAPYHVFSETDWMPYSWSINNVVLDENMHTALALWEGGHSQEAFALAKGGLLASMFMGLSPGNVGTMDLYDVYRRESQRDFGDSAGTISRAIVEGLFGIHPDALAGSLTVTPGFPSGWSHARITHPDLGISFVRKGQFDTWDVTQSTVPAGRFKTLSLRIQAAFTGVASVRVNGVATPWTSDPDAAGRPLLVVQTALRSGAHIEIQWSGVPLHPDDATATAGERSGDFRRVSLGAFTWWAAEPLAPVQKAAAPTPFDWHAPRNTEAFETVDLTGRFNDRVSAIFAKGKYLSPRAKGVSLEQPWQGDGAWAGHLNTLPLIEDSGLRAVAGAHGGRLIMPDGISFATPATTGANNIAFTSQWDNYPREITLPLSGRASHAFFLMAGSTNFMQSRMDNGEIVVRYTDGTSARLALRNPETWWPIEQDYFIDDYQFPVDAPLPPRIDLKTGQIRVLDLATFKGKGRDVSGGAATVLDLPLDPTRQLQSLTLRTIANDAVIGLMSVTLQRR